MTSSTLTQARNIQTAKRERYKALIIEEAQGGEVDASEVLELLPHVGKSLDDFTKAAAKLQRRMEAVNQLEQADAMEPQVKEADDRYQEAFKKFLALKESLKKQEADAQKALSAIHTTARSLAGQQRSLRDDAAEVLRGTAPQKTSKLASEIQSSIQVIVGRINQRAKRPPVAPDKRMTPDLVDNLGVNRFEKAQAEYEKQMAEFRAANERDQEAKRTLEEQLHAFRRDQFQAMVTDLI